LADRVGSAFLKIGRVAADLSKVSVAVAMVREGDLCKDCRIALGQLQKQPVRAKKGEEILKGKKVTEALIETDRRAGFFWKSSLSQTHGPQRYYRKEVAKVMTRDAIKLAWERAL